MAKPKVVKTEVASAKADVGKEYTSSQLYFDSNGVRHRPGKVFTLPAGVRPGKHMVEVKDAKPKEAVKVPETLAEIARAEHKAQGDDALV